MANQASKFVLTLGSTAVLARILTPEDFGLIAMVLAIMYFVALFKDLGLSMATVQRPDIHHGQVSTLFWINVLIGLTLVAVTAAASPIIARFYKEPRLFHVTLVLAGTLLFSALTVQHQALLRRQMRFGALAGVEITALVMGIAVAVVSALLGARYWSLVLLHATREVSTTIGVWTFCGWRPGGPIRRSGVRSILAFGGYLTGFNLVNYFARNLDNVLIGWYWGASPLGLYDKAYQLLLLPVQQINTPLSGVAIPTLSRLQAEPERYRAYYRRGVQLAVSVGMPVVAWLFVSADKAILTLLGSQWIGAVAVFKALAPAAFLGTMNMAAGWVYVSLGNTRRQFFWGIIGSSVIVTAFVIGLRWGPIGVGVAYSGAIALIFYPSVAYCFRTTHLRTSDLGIAVWRPALSSILAGAVLYLFGRVLHADLPVALGLGLDFVAYAVVYLAIWVAIPGGRRTLVEILRLGGELRRTRLRTDISAITLSVESEDR